MERSAQDIDDNLARSLGARLRTLREQAELDVTSLASRCGMKQPYLSRVEAGRTLPGVRTLAKLAIVLDVPLTALLEDVEYKDVELAPRSQRD